MANNFSCSNFSIDFWQYFLKSRFLINSKRLKTINGVKKIILPEKYDDNCKLSFEEFQKLPFVFELELFEDSNVCILDFDCVLKLEQKKYFNSINFLDKIKQHFKNAYIETSFNGGVHVILKTLQNFHINLDKHVIDEKIVIEFKTKCLVSPSINYTVQNIPQDIEYQYDLDDVFSTLSTICETSIIKDDFLVVQNKRKFNEKSTQDINKNKKIKKDVVNSEGRVLKRNFCDFESDHVESADERSLDENGLDNQDEQGNNQENISSSSIETIIRDYAANLKNDSGISKQIQQQKLHKKIYNLEKVLHNVSKWSKKICIRKQTSITNFNFEQEYAKQFNNYSFFIIQSIFNIDKYLHDSEKVGERVYGSNLVSFLLNLQLADKPSESIFHTLENTPLWYEWTCSFCKIIINIKSRFYTTGKYSNTPLDDYTLYRQITFLNKVGKNLTEEEAKQEYIKIYETVWNKYNTFRYDPAYLFSNFILTTLNCIEINTDSINALVDFCQYFTRQYKKTYLVEWAVRRLFRITLKNLDYKLSHIYDDSHQGKKIKTTLLYIKHLPWIKTSSEVFIKFLRATFPDFSSAELSEIINSLNNMCENNGETLKTGSWCQQIPFLNGVIDFSLNQSFIDELNQHPLQTFGESLGQLNESDFLNDDNKLGFTLALNRLCKYARRGTFSKQYLDRLAQQTALVENKSFKKDFFLAEPTDDMYKDFSIFRNYRDFDSVLEPISDFFNFDEYIKDFDTTHLLSLNNTERYDIWPMFVRCMFGDSPSTGMMAPFHLQNFLGVMLVIGMGILRRKIFQNCLVLQGSGSNGKSALLTIISEVFSNKCVTISSETYFRGDEINMQVNNVEEAMILLDTEASTVKLSEFKKTVADVVKFKRREIFKNPKDTESRAFIILATNKGLKYTREKELAKNCFKDDISYYRRIFFMIFYNKLGFEKLESLLQMHNFDLKNKLVKERLKKGFLYYILDIIHVFNLASLSGSNSQYIQSSIASKRNLALTNCEIMNLIYKHYIPYGEIGFSQQEILKKTQPVRLDDIINKDPVLAKLPLSFNDIRETLENLGFKVDTILKTQEKLDLYHSVQDFNKLNNMNKPIYFVYGLKERNSMTTDELAKRANPNKTNNVPIKNFEKFKSNKSFINSHIQVDHRLKYSGYVENKMYSVLKSLVFNEKIVSDMKPKISKHWQDVVQDDIINNLQHFKQI
jgi:hypothetical protein